jgi:hypothetical protein
MTPPPPDPFDDAPRRCRRCGYILEMLAARSCPECGERFDPNDPATYRVDRPADRRAAALLHGFMLGIVCLLLLPLPWWLLTVYAPAGRGLGATYLAVVSCGAVLSAGFFGFGRVWQDLLPVLPAAAIVAAMAVSAGDPGSLIALAGGIIAGAFIRAAGSVPG